MAIQGTTTTLEITTEYRTWRINIESPKGGMPILTAHREIVKSSSESVISRDSDGAIERNLGQVAAQQFTCQDGTVITPAHIAEALAGMIDSWYQTDRGM